MPSGRPHPEIIDNSDGSIAIKYLATEAGVHEMNINYNDKPAEGTPFRCIVDSVGGSFVTAYGQGLSYGASGEEASFSVVGAGDVDISIDGPSKTDMKKDKKGHCTHVTYNTMSPGEYMINIKSKGKHIRGSPFSAKVSGGEGRKRSQHTINCSSEVTLGGSKVDLTGLVGVLKTPGGSEEPCLLKKMMDGQLGLSSFIPKEQGNYQVVVTREGKAFTGSPFQVKVTGDEVCNASKVKVTGTGLQKSEANKQNEFVLDISGAGHGAIAMAIEGGHRSDISHKKSEKEGIYNMSYKPHEPGMYLVNIRYGDEHITGSPFMLCVGGEPSGRVRGVITKEIKNAAPVTEGSKCEFQLKIPGCGPLDMEATLTFPSGKSKLCEICDLPDHLYDIKFTPVESGIHTVSLKHKGLHISGSPFQYTVGQPPNLGPHKVEIGGPGLEQGEVGKMNDFNIYTREAGGGMLYVAIEGPSKAEVDVVDRGGGFTTVSYKVAKEGKYGIHIKYNDEHIPESPVWVDVCPISEDAKKCKVWDFKDRGLEVGKPVAFKVFFNGAHGELKGHMDTPSGTEEDVFIQELDIECQAVRFLPRDNGIYYVHVKMNEAHIPGSPFPMLVGKMGADPAMCMASGPGMSAGKTGQANEFTVSTVNAGEGTLSVNIDGASKCAITCTEVETGYQFAYTPMAPGDYMINIKYCNVTIAGCPTKAAIEGTGKPAGTTQNSGLVVETMEKKPGAPKKKRFVGDASKCIAKGNGLQKAFNNRAVSFTIETKDAGQGLLLVGIITPTGMPVEELTTKKTRPGIYTTSYKTREKGEHHLSIRWGNDEIPGSPFTVAVV